MRFIWVHKITGSRPFTLRKVNETWNVWHYFERWRFNLEMKSIFNISSQDPTKNIIGDKIKHLDQPGLIGEIKSTTHDPLNSRNGMEG